MQILVTAKDATTVALSDEEIAILSIALREYAAHPALGDVAYVAAVGALNGEFGMLQQMHTLGEDETPPDEEEPAAAG